MIGERIGEMIWSGIVARYAGRAMLVFGVVMFALGIAVAVGAFE